MTPSRCAGSVALASLLSTSGFVGTGAASGGPPPDLSDIPDAIVLSPGSRFPVNPIGGYVITIEDPLGPVNGAFVEVEISPEADALISWCASPYGGPAGQVHPILSGFTDANGQVKFEFYGGGCLDPSDYFGATFIAQVRSDGIVQNEPYVSSPDAVDESGKRATDTPPAGGQRRCDEIGGVPVAQVSLSDAVYHTQPVKLALGNPCTKYTPPFNGAVGVADAVFLTPYIKVASFCHCQ